MQIKLLVSAAAIALVAAVGSASAAEKFTTLDGISAFASLAGIQAVPLDTAEMASVTAAHFVLIKHGEFAGKITNGHLAHEVHAGEDGVKVIGKGGGVFIDGVDDGYADFKAIHDAN